MICVERAPINFDYEILVELNKIARYMFEENGVYGVKFGGQLEYIVNASLYPPMGVEYPMTILERAAFYWVRIATKQAYHNGNKRTALLAALTYLEWNGYELDKVSLEHEIGKTLYEITIDIANGKFNETDIYNLLLEHSVIKLFANQRG